MKHSHRLFILQSVTSLLFGIFISDSPARAQGSQPADTVPKPVLETKVVYGHSRQHRPLIAYVMGTGTNVTMISGGVHGNEPSAPGLVEDLQAYLLRHPEELDGFRVVIVPRVNPDGDAAGTRANAAGVDLNRNFPTGWRPRRKGIRDSPGTGPLSEPEARALVMLLDRYHPTKIVSVHQPFHEIVWSGGRGKALALVLQHENHYRFTDNVGYPTPGNFGDYCDSVRHIAIVTLELPYQSVPAAWAANKDALLAAIHAPAPEPTPALPRREGEDNKAGGCILASEGNIHLRGFGDRSKDRTCEGRFLQLRRELIPRSS